MYWSIHTVNRLLNLVVCTVGPLTATTSMTTSDSTAHSGDYTMSPSTDTRKGDTRLVYITHVQTCINIWY